MRLVDKHFFVVFERPQVRSDREKQLRCDSPRTYSHGLHEASKLDNRDGDVDYFAHLPPFVERPRRSPDPERVNFLHSQGAFDAPTLALQHALIEAYIEFSYPYMPIISLQAFLDLVNNNSHSQEGVRKINILLYQAILFAGSAFVRTDLLEQENPNFSSRRLARGELAQRDMVSLSIRR